MPVTTVSADQTKFVNGRLTLVSQPALAGTRLRSNATALPASTTTDDMVSYDSLIAFLSGIPIPNRATALPAVRVNYLTRLPREIRDKIYAYIEQNALRRSEAWPTGRTSNSNIPQSLPSRPASTAFRISVSRVSSVSPSSPLDPTTATPTSTLPPTSASTVSGPRPAPPAATTGTSVVPYSAP
jgi:hypothetical protein